MINIASTELPCMHTYIYTFNLVIAGFFYWWLNYIVMASGMIYLISLWYPLMYRDIHDIRTCDRAWENLSYVHILYFEKYKFEILNTLFFSCGTVHSGQIYII